MFRPEHFDIKELVSQSLYEKTALKGRKAVDKLWYLFDTELLITIDRIRVFLDAGVTINNWKWDGRFTESGYRECTSNVGSSSSQHRRGAAVDLKFSGRLTPEKLREYMLEIGAFQSGFRDRTDIEAYPFVLIKQVEWIGSTWNSDSGEMRWFHMATNPDLSAKGLTPGASISVIGRKGNSILAQQ